MSAHKNLRYMSTVLHSPPLGSSMVPSVPASLILSLGASQRVYLSWRASLWNIPATHKKRQLRHEGIMVTIVRGAPCRTCAGRKGTN